MKGSTHPQQFLLEFRQALRHLDDAHWLGTNSLLATPYILVNSGYTGADPDSRGQALQRLLRESMAELWPGTLPASKTGLMAEALRERENQAAGPRFQYLLLDVRYFRRYHIRGDFPARTKAMPSYLYLKETQFYDHLKTAVATLAELFRKRIAPTFRLETPLVPEAYVGRSAVIAALTAELLVNKMVGLRGMAGIGKSSLAAHISMDWPDNLRFWYTFRPGLNDSSQALLFSLGYFLNQTVSSALWSHMLVRKDLPVEFPLVLGLLRSDLEKMPEQQPLLCFDEYDRLFTVEGEPASDEYAEIFELLDALRGLTPVLIIGQRLHHDIDSSFRLDPLDLAETSALIRRRQPDLRDEEVKEVFHWAGGNPRYLELVSHLLRYGDSLAELRNGEKIVATKPLLKRLWRRLTDQERELLNLLSVFRTAAPTDAWAAQRHVLASLLQRDLIRADLSGALQIQPPFGEQILEDLQPGVRRQAHLFAATLLAKRGEYTEAAFHFWQAGDPHAALSLWYPHQDQEIERGQAVTAYQIFRHLSLQDVSGKMHGYLMQIQNRLLLMRGEARNVFQSAPTSASLALGDELEADIRLLQGQAARDLNDVDGALMSYDEALAALLRLAQRIASVHFQKGQLYLRTGDIATARHEARLAEYDTLRLQGLIEYVLGNHDAARLLVQKSMTIAQDAEDGRRIAQARHLLMMIAARLRNSAETHHHARKAMAYYEQIQDQPMLEGLRAEYAGSLLAAGDYEAVIQESSKALAYFELIQHQRWVSALCNNLAEAYHETGQYEDAKAYAERALAQGIPRAAPYALFHLGRYHLIRDAAEKAVGLFCDGIERAQANDDRFILAYLEREAGVALRRAGSTSVGRTHLLNAVALFKAMNDTRELDVTLNLLGPENDVP